MSNSDMRARLTVTADFASVVTEARRGGDSQREFRREVESTGSAVNQSARAQQTSLESMAAAAARAALRQDDLIAAEKRAIEVRRQAQAQERGGFSAPTRSIDGAIASVFDAGEFRSAETAADSLRQTVSGLGDVVSDAVEDMMHATVEARIYGDALDEIRRHLSPLYAESKRYEEAVDAIARAERVAAISAQEAAAARERSARAMAPVIPSQTATPANGGDVYAARMREQAEQAARAYRVLEESLNPVTRAQRELAQSQAVVTRALAQGQITQTAAAQAMQQLEDRYQGFVRAHSPAAQSAMAMERAIEAEAEAFRQLTLSLDPAIRAQAELQRAQELTTRAVRHGLTTQEEANRIMGLFEARQRQVGSSGFSMGMGIQNASYQIADFAVQVQAGQAASLALAQQLPQLLGGFGAIGAVLGAVVAVGAPLAKMWLSSGDAAGTLDDRLKRLETSISSVSNHLKILRDENLSQTFGNMTGDVRELTGVLLELDRAAELKSLRQTLDKLLREKIDPGIGQQMLEVLSASRSAPARDLDQMTRDNYAKLTGGRGPGYDEFVDRRAEIDALAKAGQVEQVIERVERLMSDFAAGGPVTELNDELLTVLTTLGDMATNVARVEAHFNGTAEAAKVWSGIVEAAQSAWKNAVERAKELRAEGEERNRVAQNELALAEVIFRHGEDSKQAEAERSRIARENYELELERAGIFEDQREQLMAAYDETERINRSSEAWADRMADVRSEIGGILASLASLGGSVVDRAARAAELQALNAGDTVAAAAARGAAVRREAEQRARLMSASGPFSQVAARVQNWWEEAGVDQDAELQAARAAAREREREANRKARGGRGSAPRSSASAGASIMEELARLVPSYENDVAAADAWREKALEGLNKTRDGYAKFADDVERIYQERLQKAYEEDLKRRDDWASGVERGLLQVEDDLGTWADTAENLVTGWAKKGEEAFVRFGSTGKASIGDMVDFMLEQFLRLAYQQNIAPGMNMLMNSAVSWIGSFLPGGAGASAPISTNHSGSPGVMRSYALPGFGDRMRQDEKLAMIRNGEEIMTSRALENAGALISNLSAIASQSGSPAVVPVQSPPMQVIVNDYSGAGIEAEQGTDSRGNPTLTMTVGRQMAGAIAQPGNPAGKAFENRYGVRQKGIAR